MLQKPITILHSHASAKLAQLVIASLKSWRDKSPVELWERNWRQVEAQDSIAVSLFVKLGNGNAIYQAQAAGEIGSKQVAIKILAIITTFTIMLLLIWMTAAVMEREGHGRKLPRLGRRYLLLLLLVLLLLLLLLLT